MTTRSPYSLVHCTWAATSRTVPFAASAPTDYRPRTLLAEERMHATTGRGAERQARKLARNITDGATPVAVYWSEKSRSVYVITRTADRVYYCDTVQPVHTSYAVYWDAETVARGIADMLSTGLRYPLVARVYA